MPSISFAPVVDFRLSDGCLRFPAFLRTRIGRGECWRVLTGSIAKQLGRTRRTILNYIHEAVPAGFLISEFDRRTGITTLRLTEQMEPPPPKPPQADRTPWPREPKPALWWPKAVTAALRRGGAKLSAAINREQDKKGLRREGGERLRQPEGAQRSISQAASRRSTRLHDLWLNGQRSGRYCASK